MGFSSGRNSWCLGSCVPGRLAPQLHPRSTAGAMVPLGERNSRHVEARVPVWVQPMSHTRTPGGQQVRTSVSSLTKVRRNAAWLNFLYQVV